MNKDIYEVTRDEYKGFMQQIKPSMREIKIENINDNRTEIKIIGKSSGKCLCSRVCDSDPEQEQHLPEKYYIFEMPNKEESQPPVPTRKVILETKEQVQALFNYISKMKKEREKND